MRKDGKKLAKLSSEELFTYVYNDNLKRAINHTLDEDPISDFGLRPVFVAQHFFYHCLPIEHSSIFCASKYTLLDAIAFAYFVARYFCISKSPSLDVSNSFTAETIYRLEQATAVNLEFDTNQAQKYLSDRLAIFDSSLIANLKSAESQADLFIPVIDILIRCVTTDSYLDSFLPYKQLIPPNISVFDHFNYKTAATDFYRYIIESYEKRIKAIWKDYFHVNI